MLCVHSTTKEALKVWYYFGTSTYNELKGAYKIRQNGYKIAIRNGCPKYIF